LIKGGVLAWVDQFGVWLCSGGTGASASRLPCTRGARPASTSSTTDPPLSAAASSPAPASSRHRHPRPGQRRHLAVARPDSRARPQEQSASGPCPRRPGRRRPPGPGGADDRRRDRRLAQGHGGRGDVRQQTHLHGFRLDRCTLVGAHDQTKAAPASGEYPGSAVQFEAHFDTGPAVHSEQTSPADPVACGSRPVAPEPEPEPWSTERARRTVSAGSLPDSRGSMATAVSSVVPAARRPRPRATGTGGPRYRPT
jgi:hypothetical protein